MAELNPEEGLRQLYERMAEITMLLMENKSDFDKITGIALLSVAVCVLRCIGNWEQDRATILRLAETLTSGTESDFKTFQEAYNANTTVH